MHISPFVSSLISILLLSLTFSSQQTSSKTFKTPVIGILTIPSDYTQYGYPPTQYSYIPASYVKHYWAAGARIIPIRYDYSISILDDLFNKINGLIIPGGGISFATNGKPKTFGDVAEYLIEKAIYANQNNDYFPIFGTCLGYQLIASVMAKNWSILVEVKAGSNQVKNVYLTDAGAKNPLYENMPVLLLDQMENNRISYFHHNRTPDPSSWYTNPYLKSTMDVLSWTYDENNSTYAAVVGGKTLPIWGMQFHPEKETYEWWIDESIPHNSYAIMYEQYFGNFFVNQTRKSNHQFQNLDEINEYDIINWPTIHLPGPFEQLYMFPNLDPSLIYDFSWSEINKHK